MWQLTTKLNYVIDIAIRQGAIETWKHANCPHYYDYYVSINWVLCGKKYFSGKKKRLDV